MAIDRILAKSARVGRAGTPPQTLLEHTGRVATAGDRLVEVTGARQLEAIGLDPAEWLPRLRRDLMVLAFLHDLGKANDHFQGMVRGWRREPQAIRHEAVSYWIASLPEVVRWIEPVAGTRAASLPALWAVAGHHRKFPPAAPEYTDDMRILLSHPDFRETLEWGAGRLGLGAPPTLADATLRFTLGGGVVEAFDDLRVEADRRKRGLTAEEGRYAALLKACLICADVAGSIVRGGGRDIGDWIEEAFANVCDADQLGEIVAKRLGGGTLLPFQVEVAESAQRVVFVRAGCGSGKTLAAYEWAARRARRLGCGLRVYFCYPTTGTASEGYRDYLKDVDLDKALVHGRAEVDMEILGLGDDEPGPSKARAKGDEGEDQPGRAENDSFGALDQWSTPLVSCTVDTVLGLIQAHRRGVLAWPSLAGAAIVFDEIHSYDDSLFAALLRFLTDVRGVPSLLMTASLPRARLDAIRAALAKVGETLGEVPGPESLETRTRYRRDRSPDRWSRVGEVLADGGKVLWVVNTVDGAIATWEEALRRGYTEAILYHSRFRYLDRVDRHKEVIKAFAAAGKPTLAITTQVAEMSLDISANMIISQIAPIWALIQRLGRLNRRTTLDDPWPFLCYVPDPLPRGYPLPYEAAELDAAAAWLDRLGDGALSQRDLAAAWSDPPASVRARGRDSHWLDGGYDTTPGILRETTPGIEIFLEEDSRREDIRREPERYRIPMPMPKGAGMDWRQWPEVAFCKVPPPAVIDYNPKWGARWKP